MNEFDPEYYLRERYRGERRQSPLVSLYYALKPLLPASLRIALRRRYARRRSVQTFPRWPIEPILVEHQREEFLRRIGEADGESVPFVNFWPGGAQFAVVLTHDVEGPAGIENIARVREIERRYGLVSAWYFVAEDYPIPAGLFDELRDDGCEIGLHGLHHDAKLFTSRRAFDAELPEIQRYLAAWEAAGFRSPATHRNAEWMPELGCLYDTTFSDTAPFEPQPGGCCSIRPYFLDEMVELPMTLVMDHTLWEILEDTSSTQWEHKSEWVIANHGLINLLVHPDYVTTPERLSCYEQFLRFIAAQQHGWHALPRHVAGWWRARKTLDALDAGSRLPEQVEVDGLRLQPTAARARLIDGEVVYEHEVHVSPPAGSS